MELKLHRTTGTADWQTVPLAQRNIWQKVAAQTFGLITPANVVTVLGLVLVIAGLVAISQYHYVLGTAALIAGRLADILDGWLAEHTGTKSKVGEFMDATTDKVTTIVTLLVYLTAPLASWWVLVALLLPQLLIIGTVFFYDSKGIRFHPSRLGKISMALAWLSLIGLPLIKATHGGIHAVLVICTMVLVITSVASGLAVTMTYLLRKAR